MYVFQAVPHINVVGVSTCCVHPGAAGTEIFRGLWGNQLFTPFLSLFFKVSIQHKISNEQITTEQNFEQRIMHFSPQKVKFYREL